MLQLLTYICITHKYQRENDNVSYRGYSLIKKKKKKNHNNKLKKKKNKKKKKNIQPQSIQCNSLSFPFLLAFSFFSCLF